MTNIEQLILDRMQNLSLIQQESVLRFIECISNSTTFQSQEQLEELLLEGLDSLDRGEGIEVTDEWWEEERTRLIDRSHSAKA